MYIYRMELDDGVTEITTNEIIDPTVSDWVVDEDDAWFNLGFVKSIELISTCYDG